MDSNYGAVMTTHDPEDQAERRLMGFSTGRREGQLMSALGQKRTFDPGNAMSALPPKADIRNGYVWRRSSGSLAMLTAIRGVSSCEPAASAPRS